MKKRFVSMSSFLLLLLTLNTDGTPPSEAPQSLLFEQEECDELAQLYEEKKIKSWGPFSRSSTLLNKALVKSYHDFANELIKQGVPLTNKTNYLMTPLAYAIIRGYLDIVELLIAKGVSLNDKETDLTPFQLAANYGQTEILKLLAQHGGIIDPPSPWGNALHLAAAGDYLNTVEFLVEDLKQKINMHDLQGQTALHHAVKTGHATMVNYLINHGIDNALKDKQGNVALALAFNDQLEPSQMVPIVHILINAGSPADAQVKEAIRSCLKRVARSPEEEKIIIELKKLIFGE